MLPRFAFRLLRPSHHVTVLGPHSTQQADATTVSRQISALLQIAGMLIAPVAFVFILYALFMYKKRTIQVRNCAPPTLLQHIGLMAART